MVSCIIPSKVKTSILLPTCLIQNARLKIHNIILGCNALSNFCKHEVPKCDNSLCLWHVVTAVKFVFDFIRLWLHLPDAMPNMLKFWRGYVTFLGYCGCKGGGCFLTDIDLWNLIHCKKPYSSVNLISLTLWPYSDHFCCWVTDCPQYLKQVAVNVSLLLLRPDFPKTNYSVSHITYTLLFVSPYANLSVLHI